VSAWTEDAFFVGRRMVERLRAEVPALRDVELIDEIDNKDARPKQFPAGIVLLDTMQPATAVRPAQPVMQMEQRWLLLIAVKTVRAEPDRNARAAGLLIPACIRALQGWTPTGINRPLTWAPSPRPDYGKDMSLYALMWRAEFSTAD